jgi:hypothetical protein
MNRLKIELEYIRIGIKGLREGMAGSSGLQQGTDPAGIGIKSFALGGMSHQRMGQRIA